MAAGKPIPPSAWDEKLLQNPHAVSDKRRRVQKMFAAIAPSYDLNNRLHSLWMDQAWRRKAVKLAGLKAMDQVVDVACGTGDLTLRFLSEFYRLHRRARWRAILKGEKLLCHQPIMSRRPVFGVDFTYEMLPLARKKTPHGIPYHLQDKRVNELDEFSREARDEVRKHMNAGWIFNGISWLNGDAQSLPLLDASADIVSIAFGIRNVQDPALAIREFRRILRPGGRLIILEFSLPTNPVLRGLYNFYFRKVLPTTATWISRDKTGAYKYLPESVNTFIGREQMTAMMRDAGFERVEQFPMTFGVCVCYRGLVPV